MKIAVDIDGCLTNETEGHDYKKRTPNQKMIDWVNHMYRNGNEITLWTSRYPEDIGITHNWLRKNKVCYSFLLLDKPKFDIYIDDLAKRPEEILKESSEP